jgi:hypothetical protein
MAEDSVRSSYKGPRNAVGERHGIGHWQHSDGRLYVGGWQDGRRHGSGEMTYADGTQFKGEFSQGLRDGQGTLVNPSGDLLYEGQWQGGLMHGQGTFMLTPSSNIGVRGIYRGGFRRGTMNGIGAIQYDDGCSYEGQWCDGQKEGHGKFTDENGSHYEGEWKENVRHGHGTFYTPQGVVVYTGQFHHNRWASFNRYRLRWHAGWCIAHVLCPACGIGLLVLLLAVLLAAPPT